MFLIKNDGHIGFIKEKKYKNTVDLDYEGAPSFFSLQNQ